MSLTSEIESEVTQSCLTVCDPTDRSLQGTSVHGIFQARVLEWVVISFSRGLSQPRDWTQVSCIVGRFFISWATRESKNTEVDSLSLLQVWPRSLLTQELKWPRNWNDPGIKPETPALQADSLPTELSGHSVLHNKRSHHNEKPVHHNKEPRLVATREKPVQPCEDLA